jgi:putative CocE/NonD family hydrolase
MKAAVTMAGLLALTVLAGCLSSHPSIASPAPDALQFPNAYPPTDGSAWPVDLKGPFKALPPVRVDVPADDGVKIDGWLIRPVLPDGVKAPVLIQSSPYFVDANDASTQNNVYVQAGYAVMTMSVRGTGNSGGCLDFFGPREQKDQAEVVEWAGTQPWSNGRVGMHGGSYDGTTVLEAAIQAPPHLKAAVAVAPVPNLLLLFTTPQGAVWTAVAAQLELAFSGFAAAPRLVGDPDPSHIEAAIAKLTGDPTGGSRLCPDVAQAFTALTLDPSGADRPPAFWQARDMYPRLHNITAATIYTDGYYDDQYFEGPHVFPLFTGGPFQYWTGPWPHQAPDDHPDLGGFQDYMIVKWFDYWLKGVGDRPADLGKAIWEDAAAPGVAPTNGKGAWHVSDAWPPPESADRLLNLSAARLAEHDASTERTYRSVPIAEGESGPMLGPGGWLWPKAFPCDETDPVTGPVRLVYSTPPAARPWLVAGIPRLDLNITSDQPGGIVNAFLLDEQTDGCSPPGEGGSGNTRAALVSFGAADLLHVGDMFASHPFPTGTPTHIQIELSDIAQVVQPGHRLVLVLSAGNPVDHTSRYQSTITVHAGTAAGPTRLTLPVVGNPDASPGTDGNGASTTRWRQPMQAGSAPQGRVLSPAH